MKTNRRAYDKIKIKGKVYESPSAFIIEHSQKRGVFEHEVDIVRQVIDHYVESSGGLPSQIEGDYLHAYIVAKNFNIDYVGEFDCDNSCHIHHLNKMVVALGEPGDSSSYVFPLAFESSCEFTNRVRLVEAIKDVELAIAFLIAERLTWDEYVDNYDEHCGCLRSLMGKIDEIREKRACEADAEIIAKAEKIKAKVK